MAYIDLDLYILTIGPQDGVEPMVFEVQGIQWLHFVLMTDLLGKVDLLGQAQAEVDNVCVKLFNTSIHTWTKVPIGHVITLQHGDCIFLKALDVSECVSFDALLAGSKHTDPHISKNLPRERTFICHSLAAKQADNELDITPIWPSCPLCKFSQTKLDVAPIPCHPPSCPLRKFSQTHPSLAPIKMEPAEQIDLTITDDEDLDEELPYLPVPNRKQLKQLLSSSSTGSSYHHHSPSPSDHDDDDTPRVWPADFYTVDIVHGFDKCEQA